MPELKLAIDVIMCVGGGRKRKSEVIIVYRGEVLKIWKRIILNLKVLSFKFCV